MSQTPTLLSLSGRTSIVFALALVVAAGCAPIPPAAAPTNPASPPASAAPVAAASAGAAASALPSATSSPSAAPLAQPSASFAPPESPNVTVPQFAVSALMLPTWIALENGSFAKYGINLDIPNVPSTEAVQLFISGDFNFGATGGYNVPYMLQAGKKTQIYGWNLDHHAYDFYVQPSINSFNDLQGRSVGVSELGGAPHAAALAILQKEGVDPTQVTFVVMGDINNILTGMLSGQVAGGAFGPPQTVIAQQRGLKRLAQLGPLHLLYPNIAIVGNSDWVARNPNTAKAYLRGFLEGLQSMYTDRENAIGVMAKRMSLDPGTDRDALEAGYDYAADNMRKPRDMAGTSPELLQATADSYQGDAKVDVSGTVPPTPDLFAQLAQEQFFDFLDQTFGPIP